MRAATLAVASVASSRLVRLTFSFVVILLCYLQSMLRSTINVTPGFGDSSNNIIVLINTYKSARLTTVFVSG